MAVTHSIYLLLWEAHQSSYDSSPTFPLPCLPMSFTLSLRHSLTKKLKPPRHKTTHHTTHCISLSPSLNSPLHLFLNILPSSSFLCQKEKSHGFSQKSNHHSVSCVLGFSSRELCRLCSVCGGEEQCQCSISSQTQVQA